MCWNWIKDDKPKAKKDHRCYLCAEIIKKGDTHIARTGSFDGKIYTHRMHFECMKATEDWSSEDWECHESCEFQRPNKEKQPVA